MDVVQPLAPVNDSTRIAPSPPRSESPAEFRIRVEAERSERDRQYREQERLKHIDRQLARFATEAGQRYAGLTLDQFEVLVPAQQQAVESVRRYCGEIADHVKAGTGIVLFGPAGTGKDHMLASAARTGIESGVSVKWVSGCDLFGQFRDALDGHSSEAGTIRGLTSPAVLVLSDPLPPTGALTDFQRAQLFRVLDGRYRDQRATWATINVGSREELDDRLGVQLADRLLDGALVIPCNWPSYRATRRMTLGTAIEGQ